MIESLESQLFQWIYTNVENFDAWKSWVEDMISQERANFSDDLKNKLAKDEEVADEEAEQEKKRKKEEQRRLLHEVYHGDQRRYNKHLEEEKKSAATAPPVPPHIYAPVTMKMSKKFVTLVYLIQHSGAALAVALRDHFGADKTAFLEFCLDIAYIYAVVSSPPHEKIARPQIVPSINIELILFVLKEYFSIHSKKTLKNLEFFLETFDFPRKVTPDA